jgi:3-hydroxyacyl-CoA dehydrogenase/3a,7a,12a-trihydroxy-5b-cholest-24-enoyl-CoA hydratase
MKHFCDNRTQKFKAVRLRFASPVIPGDTLVTKMWQEGNRVIFTTEVKETGKIVISNAFVEMHDAGAKL